MILLDTNAAIAIINRKPASVRENFASRIAGGETVAVSSVVVFELRYGVAKSRQRDFNTGILNGFLSGPVTIVSFDEIDAARAAEVRVSLELAGTPIGPYDVLIAGQALRHGATLITANVGEFGRVEGLKWEDWGSTGISTT